LFQGYEDCVAERLGDSIRRSRWEASYFEGMDYGGCAEKIYEKVVRKRSREDIESFEDMKVGAPQR
jgi:hypothetical protein